MRIKKVSQTTPTQAQVVDGYSASTTDSYSCNYANNNFQNSYNLITDGSAVKTGRQVDGYDEYVQRFSFNTGAGGTFKKDFDCTDKTIIDIRSTGWATGTKNWFYQNVRHDLYGSGSQIDAADWALWCIKSEGKLVCKAYTGNITHVYANVYYINKTES